MSRAGLFADCPECEGAWLGHSEWGYCPLCGGELTELEVRGDA